MRRELIPLEHITHLTSTACRWGNLNVYFAQAQMTCRRRFGEYLWSEDVSPRIVAKLATRRLAAADH